MEGRVTRGPGLHISPLIFTFGLAARRAEALAKAGSSPLQSTRSVGGPRNSIQLGLPIPRENWGLRLRAGLRLRGGGLAAKA